MNQITSFNCSQVMPRHIICQFASVVTCQLRSVCKLSCNLLDHVGFVSSGAIISSAASCPSLLADFDINVIYKIEGCSKRNIPTRYLLSSSHFACIRYQLAVVLRHYLNVNGKALLIHHYKQGGGGDLNRSGNRTI